MGDFITLDLGSEKVKMSNATHSEPKVSSATRSDAERSKANNPSIPLYYLSYGEICIIQQIAHSNANAFQTSSWLQVYDELVLSIAQRHGIVESKMIKSPKGSSTSEHEAFQKQKEVQLGTLILSYLIKQSLNCPIFPFQQQLRDLVDS